MKQRLFELVGGGNPEAFTPEFIRNFQTALLLSLLDKRLLTQMQFECCAEELQKRPV